MFISFSNFLSVSLHLSGLKIFPPILKSLSTGPDEAGIINQSTITLCNFYYNYYYRRVFVLTITITLVLRLSITITITITLYQVIFTITITYYPMSGMYMYM